MTLRKTKIVCTIGPAVQSPVLLQRLLHAGMNVARFNFSHGDHDVHRQMIRKVREASVETGIPVALLADTKGPEIRTGDVLDGEPIRFVAGKEISLTTLDVPGTSDELSVSYARLPSEVTPGTRLLIADGMIELEVISSTEDRIQCLIHSEGEIGPRKNVNVIGVRTKLPAVSEKDRSDLAFVMEQEMDFVAASFVRKATDVKEIQLVLEAYRKPNQPMPEIIAKIEDEEGLSNIDDIIRVSSGIMVARGDLGVQLPPEEIPHIQKQIVKKCNENGKVVIVATQMLESMTQHPLPTRAEAADVANAIMDGADAVMLSAETAQGKYPLEAATMLHRIAMETERSEYAIKSLPTPRTENVGMSDSIAMSAVITAEHIGADAILAPTYMGNTPRLLSRYRPARPVIAVTPFEHVRRRLLLRWGVHPLVSKEVGDADTMIQQAIDKAMMRKILKPFDRIVLAAGIPIGSPVMLNTVRVMFLADIVAHGLRSFGTSATGRVVKAASAADMMNKLTERTLTDGRILVTRYLDESYMPILEKIDGYIVEHFSSMPWSAIAKINPNLAAIAGAPGVFEMLTDGELITLDIRERLVMRRPEN